MYIRKHKTPVYFTTVSRLGRSSDIYSVIQHTVREMLYTSPESDPVRGIRVIRRECPVL